MVKGKFGETSKSIKILRKLLQRQFQVIELKPRLLFQKLIFRPKFFQNWSYNNFSFSNAIITKHRQYLQYDFSHMIALVDDVIGRNYDVINFIWKYWRSEVATFGDIIIIAIMLFKTNSQARKSQNNSKRCIFFPNVTNWKFPVKKYWEQPN